MTAPLRITDPAAFGRVAVLLGGTSSEREVSLDSGRNVLAALQARGVDATAVDGIPALVAALTGPAAQRFDRVFNILHGNRGGGEDGVLQGLLEALGVPYTGSGVLGSALAMDKIRTKQVWLALGLPTPAYVSLQRGEDVIAAAHKIGLPVIVKPACEGSSVGVTRCFADADLPSAVELAARYEGSLLVEQLIQGDEYTVSILGTEALPSIRIVPAGEYYDYHAKYVAEDTQYLCPGLDRCRRTGNSERCARIVLRGRLQRLGPRRFHARSFGSPLAARGQYGAGHDQPLAGAEGRTPARHRVRRTGLARPRNEPRAAQHRRGRAMKLPWNQAKRRQATVGEPHWWERVNWRAAGVVASVLASCAVFTMLLLFALDRPVRRVAARRRVQARLATGNRKRRHRSTRTVASHR